MNYEKIEEKIKDKKKEIMDKWKESMDKGNELLHKWEDKSKEFIGNFLDMFGKDGKIVSVKEYFLFLHVQFLFS